ncbi:MAG: hypothetical protein VX498_06420 [Myxococcota bacterium]|nr:hypothetical protein [Myxococcota bacterium]
MTRRPPRYLFVCTANINRSPMAAAWAERLFAERLVAVEVRSAGTHAWSGGEAAAYAVDAMRELGFDLRSHRSQPLDRELVHWADHVVVMEPGHARITRSINDESLPGSEGRTQVEGLWPHLAEAESEVPDPQGMDLSEYRRSASSIGVAVGSLVESHLAATRGRS